MLLVSAWKNITSEKPKTRKAAWKLNADILAMSRNFANTVAIKFTVLAVCPPQVLPLLSLKVINRTPYLPQPTLLRCCAIQQVKGGQAKHS